MKFRCEKCGQKVRVPEEYAGRRGKCPKCGGVVVIPRPGEADSEEEKWAIELEGAAYAASRKRPGGEPDVYSIHEEEEEEQGAVATQTASTGMGAAVHVEVEREEPGARRFPRPIDILLYPTSASGGVLLGILLALELFARYAVRILGPLTLLILPLSILFGVYVYWYYAECVRSSALGETRAPDSSFNEGGFLEMFLQLLRLFGCAVVFVAPCTVYEAMVEERTAVFWCMLGWAVFFFPIGLLAVVLYDSLSGLNPYVLVRSVVRTFFPYCGLVLVVAGTWYGIDRLEKVVESDTLGIVVSVGSIWVTMVLAHLLGRFYFRYREKLDWDV